MEKTRHANDNTDIEGWDKIAHYFETILALRKGGKNLPGYLKTALILGKGGTKELYNFRTTPTLRNDAVIGDML